MDSWFDVDHLNEEASVRFTGHLAESLAGYVTDTMPGLELVPSTRSDVDLDLGLLAENGAGLRLADGMLVIDEDQAYLMLDEAERMGVDTVEITLGGGSVEVIVSLQQLVDGYWGDVGVGAEWVGEAAVELDASEILPGTPMRVQVLQGGDSSIVSVRLLDAAIPSPGCGTDRALPATDDEAAAEGSEGRVSRSIRNREMNQPR
jgi:hypothetical protein